MLMKIKVNYELCLNKRFINAKCTGCIDICPVKAINKRIEIDKDCINCGLCLSHCPVEAIAGVSYSENLIQQLIDKDEPIRLICQRCQANSVWPCLGFIDTKLLLAFVISNKDSNRAVVIYKEECSKCNIEISQYLERTLGEANRLLGPSKQITSSAKEEFSESIPVGASRRQFITQLWGASISTVKNIAFGNLEEVQPIPRRGLFISYGGVRLFQSTIFDQTTFKSLAIGESCNACGICAKVCIAGAISTVAEGELIEIRHNPALCNNCRICMSQCPQNAISLVQATSLIEAAVGRGKMPICTDCGKVYQPLGNMHTCIDCVQKIKIILF